MFRHVCFIISVLLFSSQVHSADAYRTINTHTIANNYLSELTVANDDGSFLYDVKQVRTGSGYTSNFTVFKRENDGSFQQSQILEIPASETEQVGVISELVYYKNYLLALSAEPKLVYYRFEFDEHGHLNYLDKQTINRNVFYSWSKMTNVTENKFFQTLDSRIAFWQISDDGMLSFLMEERLPIQSISGADDYFISVLNPNTLIFVILNDDYFGGIVEIEFDTFEINWSNNLLRPIHTTSINFDRFVNDSSDNRLVNLLVKPDASAIYLRTTNREYIFNGINTDSVELEFSNNINLGSLGLDQTHQLAFEVTETIRQVEIDWKNNDVLRENLESQTLRGEVKILTSNMLMRLALDGKEGELWKFNQNGIISKVAINIQNTGDLPSDSHSDYYFNEKTQQLLITGDSNPEPGVTEDKLYVWQYDATLNDMSFVGASLTASPIRFDRPIGSVGNHYYVFDSSHLFSTITVLSKTDSGIEIIQEYDISDAENRQVVEDVFLATDNTLIATMRSSNLTYKICKLDDQQGDIIDCSFATLFSELEFLRDFSGYTFHKINDEGQFLFASDSYSEETLKDFYILEFNGEEFVVKQSFPLNEKERGYESISAFLSINNGTEIFLEIGSKNKHLKLIDNEWVLSEKEADTFFINVTGSNDYYITPIGQPLVFEPSALKFWRTEQRINLSGWFQVVDGNKGFVINVTETDRHISTFELVDTKPYVNKRNFNNGTTYYATEDELFEIDFSEYVLNPESTIRVETHEKFTLDQGKLSGILTNEDILKLNYRPGLEIEASFYIDDVRIGYFYIVPVNVNDIPELIAPVNREYLKVNDMYEVDLNDYVLDQDNDYLTFKTSDLPDGYSQSENYINGASSKTGDYEIVVIVTDNNGGELVFSIPVTINESGTAPLIKLPSDSSSGGGSSELFFIILLLLGLIFRLKPEMKMLR